MDRSRSRGTDQTAAPEVSLVMPMYNEAAVIGRNLAELAGALPAFAASWEIVLVDDGSTDGSADAARLAAGADGRIRILSYPQNRGRGYALRQGIAASRGAAVVTTESDLTWGSGIVARLHGALLSTGADAVVASPYLPGGGYRNVPFRRRALSRAGNKLLGLALGGRVTMASGMTRAYRGDVVRSLDLAADDKEIHLEILSKLFALGARVTEIPATLAWEDKGAGARSGRSTFRAGRFVLTHLLFSFEEYPFLLFGGLGGLLLLLGAAIGGGALLLSLRGVAVGGRPMTIGAVLLILFGLQVMLFSFLALQNRKLTQRLDRLAAHLRRLAARQESHDREGA